MRQGEPRAMGVKRAHKPQRVPRHKSAPAASPPEGLAEALNALEVLQSTGDVQGLVLPEATRACLDTISARKDRPKRLAVLPVEIADALVEEHVKMMRGTCGKCADILLAKFAQLDDNKIGGRPHSPAEDGDLVLLGCMRKSSRCLWIQLQTTGSTASFLAVTS